MARKIVIKKSSITGTGISADTNIQEYLLRGKPIEIGTEVLIKHFSSASWVKSIIKDIKKSPSGKTVFYFFIPKPGWISLEEDRVKFITKKKIKIAKGENQ